MTCREQSVTRAATHIHSQQQCTAAIALPAGATPTGGGGRHIIQKMTPGDICSTAHGLVVSTPRGQQSRADVVKSTMRMGAR